MQHWWRQTVATVYPTNSSSTAVTLNTSKDRLTGLASGTIQETHAIDAACERVVERKQ